MGIRFQRSLFIPNTCKRQVSHGSQPRGPCDVSGKKLSPHCLETIFDSQLPSPKSSPKMPPKLSLPHRRGHFSSFKITPAVRAIARQLRDKNCPGPKIAPGHQDVSQGPLGMRFKRCHPQSAGTDLAWVE